MIMCDKVVSLDKWKYVNGKSDGKCAYMAFYKLVQLHERYSELFGWRDEGFAQIIKYDGELKEIFNIKYCSKMTIINVVNGECIYCYGNYIENYVRLSSTAGEKYITLKGEIRSAFPLTKGAITVEAINNINIRITFYDIFLNKKWEHEFENLKSQLIGVDFNGDIFSIQTLNGYFYFNEEGLVEDIDNLDLSFMMDYDKIESIGCECIGAIREQFNVAKLNGKDYVISFYNRQIQSYFIGKFNSECNLIWQIKVDDIYHINDIVYYNNIYYAIRKTSSMFDILIFDENGVVLGNTKRYRQKNVKMLMAEKTLLVPFIRTDNLTKEEKKLNYGDVAIANGYLLIYPIN